MSLLVRRGPHITDVLRHQFVGVRKQAETGHLLQDLQTLGGYMGFGDVYGFVCVCVYVCICDICVYEYFSIGLCWFIFSDEQN